MEAKPTYHLPPNFSTPPPPNGPFHLGTVLRDFEAKEEMRPLNQADADRIAISEKYKDHKGGFKATRKKLKSGEFGLWAKFMGLEGVGGEAGISVEWNDSDRYEFESIETEFFYPNSEYISDCLKLPDVQDYLNGSRYKKPIYLITGIKVGVGVTIKIHKKRDVTKKLNLGLSNLGDINTKVGPKLEGKLEDEADYVFTNSENIIVGIQCLKIYHERSRLFGLFGKREVKSYQATSGATFYGQGDDHVEEKLIDFITVNPEDCCRPGLTSYAEGDEIWILPRC